jgi:hypothetical protein
LECSTTKLTSLIKNSWPIKSEFRTFYCPTKETKSLKSKALKIQITRDNKRLLNNKKLNVNLLRKFRARLVYIAINRMTRQSQIK